MSESHVCENNPRLDAVLEDTTATTTDNPTTHTNPTGQTGPSQAKKRKAISSRSDVWDHFIKWDEETDATREEGEETLLKSECRCSDGITVGFMVEGVQ